MSLNARGDESTGWSHAWKINFWARLGDGNRAHRLLPSLINLVGESKTSYGKSGSGVYANLFYSHPPFQIDGNLAWKDGHLTRAVIHSKSGRPCRVVHGGEEWKLQTTPGQSYPLTLEER